MKSFLTSTFFFAMAAVSIVVATPIDLDRRATLACGPGTTPQNGGCVCTDQHGTTVNNKCACVAQYAWNTKLNMCSPSCNLKFQKLNSNGYQCDCIGTGSHWQGPGNPCACNDDNATLNTSGNCVCKAGYKTNASGGCVLDCPVGTSANTGTCVCTDPFGSTVNGKCACTTNYYWNTKMGLCSPTCLTGLTLNVNGRQCDCPNADAHWQGPGNGCACNKDESRPANGICPA